MVKLYQLPQAFAEVEAMTEDGELTPEAFAKLTSLELELKQKLDGCCRVMRHFEAQAAAFNTEADRLAKHAKAAANSVEWLKSYMEDNLAKMGIEKIETDLFKLRLQNNPPSCQIDPGLDVATLPPYLVKQTIEVDRRACLQFAKGDGPLPKGISIVQTKSLRIS